MEPYCLTFFLNWSVFSSLSRRDTKVTTHEVFTHSPSYTLVLRRPLIAHRTRHIGTVHVPSFALRCSHTSLNVVEKILFYDLNKYK